MKLLVMRKGEAVGSAGRPGGESRSRWHSAATTIAAYVLWLAAGAAGMGVLILWVTALGKQYRIWSLVSRSSQAVWAYPAFHNGVVLALALTWLVLMVLGESWFRSAVRLGLLWRRVLWVAVAEALAAGLGYLVLRL